MFNPEAIVREWGLSHATLEEVFLAVAKKSNFTYDKIEMRDSKTKRQPAHTHSHTHTHTHTHTPPDKRCVCLWRLALIVDVFAARPAAPRHWG